MLLSTNSASLDMIGLTHMLVHMVLTLLCWLVLLIEQEVHEVHTKVDLVITLGGDGTVLWVFFLNHLTYL